VRGLGIRVNSFIEPSTYELILCPVLLLPRPGRCLVSDDVASRWGIEERELHTLTMHLNVNTVNA